jgi:hypothetical protein
MNMPELCVPEHPTHERPDCHDECAGEVCAICGCQAHAEWNRNLENQRTKFALDGEELSLCSEHQRFTPNRLRQLLAELRAAATPEERAAILQANSGPWAAHRHHPVAPKETP